MLELDQSNFFLKRKTKLILALTVKIQKMEYPIYVNGVNFFFLHRCLGSISVTVTIYTLALDYAIPTKSHLHNITSGYGMSLIPTACNMHTLH
jgi:hypothetical protein